MAWWPGWSTIEGSTSWGQFWVWFGIACLFLFAASEVVAYKYGLHKADLIAAAAVSHDRAEVGPVHPPSHEPKDAAIKQDTTPREQPLSGIQKQALITALRPFQRQSVDIVSIAGDKGGERLKQEFVEILRAANWSFDPASSARHIDTAPLPVGVQVTVNQDEAKAGGPVLNAAETFVHALLSVNITDKNMLFVNNDVPIGQIRLVIGTRP